MNIEVLDEIEVILDEQDEQVEIVIQIGTDILDEHQLDDEVEVDEVKVEMLMAIIEMIILVVIMVDEVDDEVER